MIKHECIGNMICAKHHQVEALAAVLDLLPAELRRMRVLPFLRSIAAAPEKAAPAAVAAAARDGGAGSSGVPSAPLQACLARQFGAGMLRV